MYVVKSNFATKTMKIMETAEKAIYKLVELIVM